LQSACTKRRKP